MAPVLPARSALRGGARRRGRIGPWIRGAWAALLVAAGPGCKPGTTPASSIPDAAAYDAPSRFGGRWLGEIDGDVGTLSIDPLGPGRYRGFYEGEEVAVEYVLSLTQDLISVGEQQIPANRAVFTWQDGRGGRGDGWLLINREDSALTGAFGEGGRMDRSWTFIRVE